MPLGWVKVCLLVLSSGMMTIMVRRTFDVSPRVLAYDDLRNRESTIVYLPGKIYTSKDVHDSIEKRKRWRYLLRRRVILTLTIVREILFSNTIQFPWILMCFCVVFLAQAVQPAAAGTEASNDTVLGIITPFITSATSSPTSSPSPSPTGKPTTTSTRKTTTSTSLEKNPWCVSISFCYCTKESGAIDRNSKRA